MSAVAYKTPGVYIKEPNSFPPSIVGVETAVPAFIGYTETAIDDAGASLLMIPKRITSMMEFASYFGGPARRKYALTKAQAAPPPAAPTQGPAPAAPAAPVLPKPQISIGGDRYDLEAVTGQAPHLYLYDSLQLFYANGGGACYILSCGPHSAALPGPNVKDLTDGLEVCGNLSGPTMLVIPDALLLNDADYINLSAAMLKQCRDIGDRVALLDVHGSDTLPPRTSRDTAADLVTKFREDLMGATTPDMLKYGIAYFPALVTSIIPASAVDLSFFDLASLEPALNAAVDLAYPAQTPPGSGAKQDKNQLIKDTLTSKLKAGSPLDPLTLSRINQGLLVTLPVYGTMSSLVAKDLNVLPASAAMAGVYAAIDTFNGVWNAPANVGIAGMVAPTYALSGDEQDDLNVPVSGMAVNAIRTFPGRGNVVWGARTLDGNSNDWRYIQVRRTMIYVEQSVKDALQRMVFQPNTAQTWTTVTSMIESFLHGLWAAGGLMGGSPSEAFSVAAGLGATMTPQDVLNGVMRVTVVLQMIHPAEFIELTFQQKMGGGT